MRSPSVLIGWPLLVLLLSPCAALADNNNTSNDHASPSIAAQPNDAVTPNLPAGQPSVDANSRIPALQPAASSTTLELSPQPSAKTPSPEQHGTADQRAFRQQSKEDEIARLNRNFHPHDSEDSHRPYLGIDLEYSTQCYLGMEEHGFEVVSV